MVVVVWTAVHHLVIKVYCAVVDKCVSTCVVQSSSLLVMCLSKDNSQISQTGALWSLTNMGINVFFFVCFFLLVHVVFITGTT